MQRLYGHFRTLSPAIAAIAQGWRANFVRQGPSYLGGNDYTEEIDLRHIFARGFPFIFSCAMAAGMGPGIP